jgi:hypothetical protein
MKWEYQILQANPHDSPKTVKNFEDSLNDIGKEGWELCGVVPSKKTNVTVFVFKRETK